MIRLQSVYLQRAAKSLLRDVNWVIHSGQRIGITGANGCGKSSLFQLLLGQLSSDRGDVTIPSSLRIAHMAQEVPTSALAAVEYVLDGDRALRDAERGLREAEQRHDDAAMAHWHSVLDALGGYNAHYRAEQLLHGLGFSTQECTRGVNTFSGGWRIRLNLAQALMAPSDLMLLDEPTNHLDLDALVWLETWLKRFPGTLLLISHDRDFLDSVCTHIAHIENEQLTVYTGNYSQFERQRAERLAQQQFLFEQQQRRVADIEQFVRRFKAKASKAKQAQSRVKELERMELIAPAHVDSPFKFEFLPASKQSTPLLTLDQASIGYQDKVVASRINVRLLPGSRIGLLGPNGAGKSTLVKSLVGALPLVAGARVGGEHLSIGYFAQHQLEALDLKASALTHLQRLSPTAAEQTIRNFLGGFDFHGDAATGPITHFSGGEKARLALAIIAWQRPNLLLLDEPTNHLDLEMRHALTMALQNFEGALIVVSHDRHLLRNTVDEFWLLMDGALQAFDGDLDDYQRVLQNRQREEENAGAAPTKPVVDRKQQRQQSAALRAQLAPLKKQITTLEKSMEKLQKELSSIDGSLADASLYELANKQTLQSLLKRQGEAKAELEMLELEWLELQEQWENAEREN
jgi:ATP-binding cassette subfamily F protein 3